MKVRLVTVSRATEQEWLRLRSQATAVRRPARHAARAHDAPYRGRSASRSMPTNTARSVRSSSQSISNSA